MSKLNSLVRDATKLMDEYDVVRASRSMMTFVQELSTWYLRRSRDRLRNDDNAVEVFGHVLLTLAQVFAPFAPFFTETMYQTLTGKEESVHLSNWPIANEQLINDQLEAEMTLIQSLVENVHSQRAEQKLRVRQPLAKVTIQSTQEKPSQQVLDVMLEEVNIKTADWQKSDADGVEIDTELTPELKAEGEARELIRSIQGLRKKQGLTIADKITVQAPEWPADWEERILKATNALSIGKNPTLEINKQ
jgi:isoleucyl-tRNA synthetase